MRLVSIVLAASCFLLFSCSPNNVITDHGIKKYFDSAGARGSFGLFDNAEGQFTIYDLAAFKDSAYPPGTSFSIVNTLIGVESGRLANEDMVLPWDGKPAFYPGGDTATAWNRDLSAKQAFAVSAEPFFRQLARRIGKDTMQLWLDSIGYGQRYGKFRINNNLDTFWLDHSLKVTADEQLGLVKKLYFDQLPFFKRTMKVVRDLMLQEQNSNYALYYQAGGDGRSMEWVTGWIEENRHPYFFVVELVDPHQGADRRTEAVRVLKGILKEKGFFLGKK